MAQQPQRPRMMERPGMTTGTIVTSALLAGLVAYMIRRRQRERELARIMPLRAITPVRGLIGDEQMRAVSEYVSERILPEFRPALVAIMEDLRDVVNEFFDRTERRIQSW